MSGRSQLQRALLDTATILSSAANVARRAAISINPEGVGGRGDEAESSSAPHKKSRATTSTPWPSQRIALQKNLHASTSHHTDVPPSAPDGTLTEMKVISRGADEGRSADKGAPAEDTDAILRQLDESLKGYFGEPEEMPEPQTVAGKTPPRGEIVAEQASSIVAIEGERPRGTSIDEAAETQSHRTGKGEAALGDEHESESSPSPLTKQAAKQAVLPPLEKQNIEGQPSDPTPEREAIATPIFEDYDATQENAASPLRAAKVPSSRIARLMHYGSLGAGLAWGAAGSYLSGSKEASGKQFMSDGNIRRLVDKLSTMRGAALKLGQFMSIQDSNLLPEQIEQVMLKVQNSANYMPAWQMEQVMREDLGLEWRESFASFNDIPFASASIGQVHIATLREDHPSPLAGQKVAVKVQFPGVRDSIGSDLSNLRWLVSASALLPKGLFLDNTIRVMRRELDDECDYEREKNMCKRFGELLNDKSNFAVPRVVDELCSKRVLTCEMMKGRPLTQASRYSQEKRDDIARSILQLSLKELFTYRLMQTDPNWTNFLYNERTGKIELIDFGATREYDKGFMDDWLCMLRAAVGGKRDECVYWSEKVGYLTGKETVEMRDAHVDSMIALGEPFRADAPDPYPFAEQTITARVRAQIPLMLRQRLTPPPEPTYSLNRKLSGAFLLCARLKANAECRTMLEDITKDYQLGNRGIGSRPVASVSSIGLGRREFHTYLVAREDQRSRQRRERLGNLAARWPRHIIEAVKEQKASGPDSFSSLAARPVSPSMSTTPPEPTGKVLAADVDLQTVPSAGEKGSESAESPRTAMDMDTNKGQTPAVIRGIHIPKKPPPPGPEECCMSGCAHCTYDIYAESLMSYQEDLSKVRTRLLELSPPLTHDEWDSSLLGERPSDDGTEGNQKNASQKAQDEVDAVIGQLDPSMKAFLQLERSLKKKGKHSTSSPSA